LTCGSFEDGEMEREAAGQSLGLGRRGGRQREPHNPERIYLRRLLRASGFVARLPGRAAHPAPARRDSSRGARGLRGVGAPSAGRALNTAKKYRECAAASCNVLCRESYNWWDVTGDREDLVQRQVLFAWDDAKIHVLSHVVSYGSSVFEGIRCYETVTGPGDLPASVSMSAGWWTRQKVYRMDTFSFSQEELAEAMIETGRGQWSEVVLPCGRSLCADMGTSV